MIRFPAASWASAQGRAFSGVPIASSESSARLGAPPCSGPERAPSAATTQAATSAPVDATTRAVNVEALKPWSTVRQRYRSTARTCSGAGSVPVIIQRWFAV